MNVETTDSYNSSVRRKIVTYALLGFPLGIAIGTILVLFQSFLVGDGDLHPVTPAMLTWMPSEFIAFFWQTLLCGILGAVCSGASPVFQIERWSLARQTVVHFLLLSLTVIPIASICGWTSPYGFNPWNILAYVGIFVVAYLIIWTSIYLYWKNWVKRANDKLA
jgi:hypothetical protein